MPVTAKLSRNFYDKFGDDIANKLVTWFNMIDTTYRTELHDLNDRNFKRFEAVLAQALAEQGVSLRKEIAEQGVTLREEIADLRKEMVEQGAALRKEITEQVTSLEVRIAREMGAQTRWIFGLWAAQIMAFIGTIFIVLQQ